MRTLRSAVKEQRSAAEVAALLDEADATSCQTVRAILASHTLRARSPSEKDGIPPCVCLSECTLPGLMSHSERYGRFGLVFSKPDVFAAGGRPCLYVGREEYGVLAQRGRGQPPGSPEHRLFALSNVYEPARPGARVQDYTHEREWRVFGDVDLASTRATALLAPLRFVPELLALSGGIPVIPLDTLFEWGA
jgi:hypothetical protein